ncbi:MAG: ATP-binding cassette, subfamily bacterial CydD [Actinomycetota bacterium]|nr:ATP-binding cassette, subfamily bacterial CydD [Actinomycetota bacterium]
MTVDRLLAPAPGTHPDVTERRALSEMLRPGRRQLTGAGIALTAASAGTAAVYFAVAAVAQDVLAARAAWPRDLVWLGLAAAGGALRAGAGVAAARLAFDGALEVERHLRSVLLDRLFQNRRLAGGSAAQATAILDEVERIGGYAERYVPARFAAGAVPLVLLCAVFPMSWVVGVLLLLCAPLPPVNLSIVGMGTAAVARRHGDELRHLSGYFLDRLRGLPTLRALGAGEAELVRVEEVSTRLESASMAVLRVAFVSAAVLEAIVTVAIAVVATYIGLTLLGYVHVPGLPSHMSLRTGLFLLMVTPLYFQPVRALAAAYHERAEALAATAALVPLLTSDEESSSIQGSVSLDAAPPIELREVTMTFPERDEPALNRVSLQVEAGEFIGITGASGAGKSTLLRLIAGDLDPSGGSVLVGAVPATSIRPAGMTWLGQRPYLFPGTLAANIGLGRTDATSKELVDVALATGLGPVLERLPRGLATPFGEGGWGVSGGEAHRVALARTMLKRAPVLLLDEPTAHLDATSEAELIEVIREVSHVATTVVATHSPALLGACNRVVTLDRGRLVASSPTPRPLETVA